MPSQVGVEPTMDGAAVEPEVGDNVLVLADL